METQLDTVFVSMSMIRNSHSLVCRVPEAGQLFVDDGEGGGGGDETEGGGGGDETGGGGGSLTVLVAVTVMLSKLQSSHQLSHSILRYTSPQIVASNSQSFPPEDTHPVPEQLPPDEDIVQ